MWQHISHHENGSSTIRLRTALPKCTQGQRLLLHITSIPFDIVLEILKHLHPFDLLQLARTTKRFRSLLMHRSARSAWVTSITEVAGLPTCPPDLTEPQYVHLAFDNHCHFCSAKHVEDIFWNCRVRCCRKCVYVQFITLFELRQKIPPDADTQKFDAIFPFIVYPKPSPRKPGRILYYRPVAEQYIRELNAVKDSHSTLDQWHTEKTVEQARRLSHATLCRWWERSAYASKQFREINLYYVILLIMLMTIIFQEGLFVL